MGGARQFFLVIEAKAGWSIIQSKTRIRTRGKDARPLEAEVGIFGAADDENPQDARARKSKDARVP